MLELIALIILISSFLGIGIMIYRKIPVLAELPAQDINSSSVIFVLKEKIKAINPLKSFSYEIFLQKALSKIRILTLKIESKIADWLQKLRKRSLKRKNSENDNYWQKFKKITKRKNKNKPA